LAFWTLGRGWHEPHQWRWWLGSAGVLAAAFLAGHSQSFLLLSYALLAWMGVLLFTHRPQQGPARWQRLVAAGIAALLAVGVTGAQWLPSLEFVRYSVRANVDYAFVRGGLALGD